MLTMTVMTALINRDPFARTELHRRSFVDRFGATCQWCGSLGKRLKYGRLLYHYETQHDGGRTDVHAGVFCSKSCHDAYHHS
jgi:hypothetical protein